MSRKRVAGKQGAGEPRSPESRPCTAFQLSEYGPWCSRCFWTEGAHAPLPEPSPGGQGTPPFQALNPEWFVK